LTQNIVLITVIYTINTPGSGMMLVKNPRLCGRYAFRLANTFFVEQGVCILVSANLLSEEENKRLW